MRTLSAGALALLAALLVVAPPASSAPSHAETGVFIAHVLPRPSAQEPFGRTEAAHAKELGVGWAAIYVDWKAMQPNGPTDPLTGPSQLHDRLATLKEKGLKVSVTFLGTPQWASGNANPYYPPNDPATFGNFVKQFAAEHGASIDAYELGNEPDGGVFWLPGPDPAKYAKYAQAGVDAVRAADPVALKFVGALVGGNATFMEQVLNAGLTGFDAVAFHSGTACKLDPPSFFNRQNAFIQATSTTAYRELIHLLKRRGLSPTVADTAAGWSTSPGLCNTPGIAADKIAGVSQDLQAKYLRDYFGCIENDPELKFVFIFELYDTSASDRWDERMGLREVPPSLEPKKSFGALQSVFGGAPGNPKPPYEPGGYCGGYVDHEPPTVELKVSAPLVNGTHLFADQPLPIYAKGTDEHPIADIDLYYDKQVEANEIATTTKNGVATFETGWFGARKLPLGDHTIIAVARDEAGNSSAPVTVKVKKVSPSQLPRTATTLTARVTRIRGRKVTIRGKLSWPAGIVKPSGRVRIWFKKGKFISRYGVTPSKPFNKTFTLRKPGKWKVSVFYDAKAPFKGSRVKTFTVRVK
jgi:hypothetical protein